MSALERYPTLKGLHDDLERLHASETVRDRMAEVRQLRIQEGRDRVRIEAPWLDEVYYFDRDQAEVVRLLMHAHLHSRCPDVDQGTLLRTINSASRRLADLFAGHEAWGVLILRGQAAGCYRIAPPPDADDVGG